MYSYSLEVCLPEQKNLVEIWKSTESCYNKIQ